MATCGKCGGRRVVSCPSCRGSGKIHPLIGTPYTCSRCRGAGKVACDRCRGTGRV